MNGTKKVLRGTGKVILALIGGILSPILIWVALGVAVNQKLRNRKPLPAPAPTIGEILESAGLHINEENTKDNPVGTRTFAQRPASEIRRLFAKAGLVIRDEPAPEYHPEPRVLGLGRIVK